MLHSLIDKSANHFLKYLSVFFIAATVVGCSNDDTAPDSEQEETNSGLVFEDLDFTPTDWTSDTHSKAADPNFEEVFDANQVKRLDFVITSENWSLMMEDMDNLYGAFGSSSSAPGGAGPGGVVSFSDEDPMFIPASVFYEGTEWYKVGLRFKGNSSLASAWGAGILKLSFKLDFDEYEDEYPQIKNQRFYGFKKLSLKNNYDDTSFMREKLSADILRDAGIPVSNTSFYTLYLDRGNGPEYFGLYTLVEEIDDTLIDTQFSSDKGNLYKPEDEGANFVEGTFNETGFDKKTNEDEADWGDIKNLFAALHSDLRTSDPSAWRGEVNAVFDTDIFLNYLAVNTVIQNWDTYGLMPHNYYLYNNPDNDKLTWIPWDYNEALQEGKRQGSLLLDFFNLESGEWPLIEYLFHDPVFKEVYDNFVQNTIDTAFEASKIQALIAQYASLIIPYASSELPGYSFLRSAADFQAGVDQVSQQVTDRTQAAKMYLEN